MDEQTYTITAWMKEEEWSEPEVGRDRRGEPIQQQYAWIKHLPGEERLRARIFVPQSALRWWRLFLDQRDPKRKRERPPKRRTGPLELQAVRA